MIVLVFFSNHGFDAIFYYSNIVVTLQLNGGNHDLVTIVFEIMVNVTMVLLQML